MRHLIPQALTAKFGLLWCSVAWAATQGESFGHELSRIPLGSYLLVLLLAGIPGAFNVLSKIEAGTIALGPRTWLTVLRELLGSVLAGYVAFFLCETAKVAGVPMPDVVQVLNIGAAGYMGARFVDRWFSKRAEQLAEGAKVGG